MEAQVDLRFKKRIPCSIQTSGRRHAGMVLNVSRGGLFVQTSAPVEPGASLAVDLNTGADASIPIDAQVVWRRVVSPHLRTLSRGGMGVRIRRAPESYYGLLSGVAGGPERARVEREEPADRSAPAEPGMRFRIRVKEGRGSRSRTLIVHGASEDEARSYALRKAGKDWVVLEVAPLP